VRSWLGLAGYYTSSFAVLGVYMQFFPAWLHDVGRLDKASVSTVLAGQTVARTLAGPFWAQRVDRLGDARRVLVGLSLASLAAFGLFAIDHTMWWAALAAFVFGTLYSPMYPIVDAAAMQASRQDGYGFGRLRMVGSVSYLVVLLLAGPALDRWGIGIVYPVLWVGLAWMVVSGFALPRRAPTATPVRTPWWALLRSRQFVLLLAASAAIQGSHATFYNLSTVHWRDHGISNTLASVLWAEGILAEIVLFFVARQTVERLRPTTLLVIGGLGAVVRWCVIASTTSVPVLLATNWLHALSFATTYMGTLRALERRVEPGQRATAQGLLGAATSGVGMVACGLLGGFLYQRWQGGAFFAMAAIAAVGVGLAVRLRRLADRGAG
jgi:PPP family 3-phenylpropionic acid transporter